MGFQKRALKRGTDPRCLSLSVLLKMLSQAEGLCHLDTEKVAQAFQPVILGDVINFLTSC